MTNDELVDRYLGGEALEDLATASDMTVAGLQARLRRINVPARRRPERARALEPEQISQTLADHGSIAGAARALGVGRAALAAQAQRHGLRPAPGIPPDLGDRYRAGATVAELARHYRRGTTTIVLWLDTAGVPRRPRGPQPRDG